MIFKDSNKFWSYIRDKLTGGDRPYGKWKFPKNPVVRLYVSTFNAWVGICNFNSPKDKSPIYGMPKVVNPNQAVVDYANRLNLLRQEHGSKYESHIIIGMKDGIINRDIPRIKRIWPHANISFAKKHHMKCVIMVYEDGEIEVWNGSCNLNNGHWNECMTEVYHNEDKSEMIKWFFEIKKTTTSVL